MNAFGPVFLGVFNLAVTSELSVVVGVPLV